MIAVVEELPEQLRDPVPPVTNCQRPSARVLGKTLNLGSGKKGERAKGGCLPSHPENPSGFWLYCKPVSLKKKPAEPYPALMATKSHSDSRIDISAFAFPKYHLRLDTCPHSNHKEPSPCPRGNPCRSRIAGWCRSRSRLMRRRWTRGSHRFLRHRCGSR